MTNHRSDTETIIAALDILAREIHSEDGVANAAIAEGAQRLRDMQRKVAEFRERKQEAETRERNAWLLRQAEARQFSEELARLRAEVEALREAYRRMKNVAAAYSNYCEDTSTTRRLEREFEEADTIFRACTMPLEPPR